MPETKIKKEDLTCPFHADLEKKVNMTFYILIFVAVTNGIDLAQWFFTFIKG